MRAVGMVGLTLAVLSWGGCRSGENGPRGAASVEEAYSALRAACASKDGARMWALLSRRYRRTFDLWARDRRLVSTRVLREVYDYRGAPGKFDGQEFLAAVVRKDVPSENPCRDAAKWKAAKDTRAGKHTVMTVTRPNGWTFFLRFLRDDGRWVLDAMSDAVRRR